MKKFIYTESETAIICKVYNYDLDTVKEMELNGWALVGTYYRFLAFRKDK